MATKYGTHRQQEDLGKQIKSLDDIAGDPYKFGSIENKTVFNKRRKDLQSQKDKITPPAISGEERKAITRRQELLEAFIKLPVPEIKKPAMPTKHEMWETPAGARGKHLTWEKSIKNYNLNPVGNPIAAVEGYGAISEWKDNQRKLNKELEANDPDIANVEQLRSQDRDKSSFADYKRVTFGSTSTYREAYEKTFEEKEPEIVIEEPHPNTKGKPEKRAKRLFTPEQRKAFGDRMRQAREARLANKQQIVTPQGG